MKSDPMLLLYECADGTGVLYNPDSGATFALNRTGMFLYRKKLEGVPDEELAVQLQQACGNSAPSEAQLDSEIAAFLEKLYRISGDH